MATVYPQQIDGYSTLPLRRDGIDEIRADDVNRLRNAIIAIVAPVASNNIRFSILF